MKMARIVCLVLALVACLWSFLLMSEPKTCQDRLFFVSAQDSFFFDYFTPYEILSADHPCVDTRPFPNLGFNFVDGGVILRRNQCCPALPVLFANLFNESISGAILCTLIGLCCYLLGLVVFLRKYKTPIPLPVIVSLVSAQVLSTFEVGNLIFYAAGGVLLYFSWYDSNSRLKRFSSNSPKDKV